MVLVILTILSIQKEQKMKRWRRRRLTKKFLTQILNELNRWPSCIGYCITLFLSSLFIQHYKYLDIYHGKLSPWKYRVIIYHLLQILVTENNFFYDYMDMRRFHFTSVCSSYVSSSLKFFPGYISLYIFICIDIILIWWICYK